MISTHPVSETLIRSILQSALDPTLQQDFVSANVLKSLNIQADRVSIALRFGYPVIHHNNDIIALLQKLLIPHLGGLKLEITIDWKVNKHLPQANLKPIPGIKNIIAIASGKGGVGKSTTAVNLALALQAEGARVGILDADIYGPSQPLMLGIQQKPVIKDNKRLEPVMRYGLQTMSMGYLVAEDAAMVWRGPMVSSALQQLLFETAWDEVDYLIIDLPPGTGDIQLTLAQKIPVAGVVIVTTPQDVALSDAKKALSMFQKLGIAALGIVENMSTHICSQCGHAEAIFGSDGGIKMASQFAVPFLGQLPLDIQIREHADSGQPSVIADPTGNVAKLYQKLARRVGAELSLRPRDYSVVIPSIVVS